MPVNQPISSPSRAVDLLVMGEEEETDRGPGIVKASRVLIPCGSLLLTDLLVAVPLKLSDS